MTERKYPNTQLSHGDWIRDNGEFADYLANNMAKNELDIVSRAFHAGKHHGAMFTCISANSFEESEARLIKCVDKFKEAKDDFIYEKDP